MGVRRWLLPLGALAVALLLAGFAVLGALAPPRPLAVPERGARFENVTVVVPGVARLPARSVSTRGGLIGAVDAARPGVAPEGFLLPGLVDMHVHAADPTIAGQRELFALLYLAHGVTSVRDTGGPADVLRATARDVRDGAFPGPRSFACGPLHDGDPPIWPGSVVIRSAAEAEAAVTRIADQGLDCVKVYERLAPEALAALAREARRRGLPVVGHVPSGVAFEEAEIDDVQHLRGVAGGTPADADPLARALARVALWRELAPARIELAVRVSRRRPVAHTPTLVLARQAARMADLEALLRDPELSLLPRFYAELGWNPLGTRWASPEARAAYRGFEDVLRGQQRMVRALHGAGVRIHAGTDVGNPFLVPGASLHQELRLLVEAGLSAEEALAAATARTPLLARAPRLGEIAPGAPADLLLFRDDPTRDLSALASLEAVVADGRLYRGADLGAAVAAARAHYRGWLYETVSMAVGRRQRARILRESRAPAEQEAPAADP